MLLLRLLLSLLLFPAFYVSAETALPWNQPADPQNCPVSDDALWLNYSGGQACIRYFSAGNLTAARYVVVIFRGDRDTYNDAQLEDIPANTAEQQRQQAEKQARKLQLPVIIVARPGTYGSSGNHRHRRQPEEFLALNAALDRLRARYGIQQFVLSGHSGGATAAAALLTLGRRDVACAVLTSGAYDLLRRAEQVRARLGRQPEPGTDLTGLTQPYDPLYHIAGIAADPDRQILVIGNPQDRVTPFTYQKTFVQALHAAGHQAQLIEWPTKPPQYHDMQGNALVSTIARCWRENPPARLN